MNAPLSLGRRHALHAMRARLEFEQRECAASNDAADDFLVTAMFAGTFAQDLDSPALGLGIARVHAKQVTREDGGLIAARAGTYLEKDIAVIVRILRHD